MNGEPIRLYDDQSALVNECVTALQDKIQKSLAGPIATALGLPPPAEIAGLVRELQGLQNALSRIDPIEEEPKWIDAGFASLIRLVVSEHRREKASDRDERMAMTNDPELRKTLEKNVTPLDDFFERPWFRDAEPRALPPLTRFLSLETVEQLAPLQPPPLQFDEKFHILQAGSLVLPMLHYHRRACERRGRSVVLAFLDIDDFKKLNTEHGVPAVDSEVLPIFMRTLEAFVFGRGMAFRFGGDEYAVILPNLEPELVIPTFQGLLGRLSNLAYRRIRERTTVSVGICTIEAGSFLTDAEALQRAERAQQFAKKKGKNRIATYAGSLFRDEDRVIAADEPPTSSPTPGGPL